MNPISLVFPHQLFEDHPAIGKFSHVYLVEETLFFKQYPFHKQKIAFHRATMKAYQASLEKPGLQVTYIDADDVRADVRKLIRVLREKGVEEIHVAEVSDDWLNQRIKSACKKHGIRLIQYPSPQFLNSLGDLEDFFSGKQFFRQTDFYISQRKKRTLLVDHSGKPLGGKWTYDTANRKKYPKKKQLPEITFPAWNQFHNEAKSYTQEFFGNNPGELNESTVYPNDFETSRWWFDQFLEKRLREFGDYQDAMVADAPILHHSLLSPMMNVGLITPKYVIDRTLAYHQENNIPINSLEGFIRQIAGWREFLRGVYHFKGGYQRTKNYWGFDRKIPKSFWEGTTGVLPIDLTIQKVLKTGYAHHIERLMILGNFMLLAEFDPDEVHGWFMSMFIDAYDWVMVPNVYGMSQYADGGLMATKPYVSGSNYLVKMSDFPKGDWQASWTALFWRFMDKHRAKLEKNPQLNMLLGTYDRMPAAQQQFIQEEAAKILKKLSGTFQIH